MDYVKVWKIFFLTFNRMSGCLDHHVSNSIHIRGYQPNLENLSVKRDPLRGILLPTPCAPSWGKRVGESQQVPPLWILAAFVIEDSRSPHQRWPQMRELPRGPAAASPCQTGAVHSGETRPQAPQLLLCPIFWYQDATVPCYIQTRGAVTLHWVPSHAFTAITRVNFCGSDATLGFQFLAPTIHCQGQALTALEPAPWVPTCP